MLQPNIQKLSFIKFQFNSYRTLILTFRTITLEINKISLAGCPESHPYVYDYYENNDYCCPYDPAQNPDSDYCGDGNVFEGKKCDLEPPCDDHPSVTYSYAGYADTAETGKSF